MPVSAIDGPLGLEALHVFDAANGGSVTLNDLSAAERYKVRRMTGFKSLPEADNNTQPRTSRIGENLLPSLVRGKTFTVEGTIQAISMQRLRQLETYLQWSFGERDLAGTWSAIPNPTYGDNTHYWQTVARVLSLDITEELLYSPQHPRGPYQMDFVLGVRLPDPRWTYSLGHSAATPGGSPSAVVACTNGGNAPADPTITIPVTGTPLPGTFVSVANQTTLKALAFNGITVSGNLVIDFAARTAKIGSTDLMPNLDTFLSSWWDRGAAGLRSGLNNIQQSGGNSMTVAWKDTSW